MRKLLGIRQRLAGGPDFQQSLTLSSQVPDLSNIKTEAELYTYLKDGTELCRMIGIVTKGTVLEKTTYR